MALPGGSERDAALNDVRVDASRFRRSIETRERAKAKDALRSAVAVPALSSNAGVGAAPGSANGAGPATASGVIPAPGEAVDAAVVSLSEEYEGFSDRVRRMEDGLGRVEGLLGFGLNGSEGEAVEHGLAVRVSHIEEMLGGLRPTLSRMEAVLERVATALETSSVGGSTSAAARTLVTISEQLGDVLRVLPAVPLGEQEPPMKQDGTSEQ